MSQQRMDDLEQQPSKRPSPRGPAPPTPLKRRLNVEPSVLPVVVLGGRRKTATRPGAAKKRLFTPTDGSPMAGDKR